MAGARGVLEDVRLKEDAVRALQQAFYANTSRFAQSQKRRDVEGLARRAAEGGVINPLQERTVLGVGGGLAGERLQECGLVFGRAAARATLKPGSRSQHGWPGRCLSVSGLSFAGGARRVRQRS